MFQAHACFSQMWFMPIGAFLKCVSGLSVFFSNVFLQVVISALFKSKRAMSAESWRLPRRLGQFWHPAQWLARHTLLTRWDIFYIICDASYIILQTLHHTLYQTLYISDILLSHTASEQHWDTFCLQSMK